MREGKKAARACLDCGAMYAVSSPRQQRCATCRAKHDRIKNKQYQAEHRRRGRQRSPLRLRMQALRAALRDPHREPPQREGSHPKEELAYNPPVGSVAYTEPKEIEPIIRYTPVPLGNPNQDETVSPLFCGLWFRW